VSTPPSLDLSDQLILITGGSGALGQVICQTLIGAGARVASLDLAAPAEPTDALAGELFWHRDTDIADVGDVDAALADCHERFAAWPTTVLCHAGVVGTHPLVDYPLDEYDGLMRTNVRGAYVPARQAARIWLEHGIAGHLVFTTSWVHQVPWPEIGPYSASKAAMVQLARSFARELAPQGIRANAVAPGIVGAGMALHQWNTDDDYRRRAARAIPLGTLQTPQSVADAFLFLCSPLASYMTGSVLSVDGGAGLYPMD